MKKNIRCCLWLLNTALFNVGIDSNVIPKYQNQNMVVIEIRHGNDNVNNTLDARYYINIYTARGYDDLENDIDLNGLKQKAENIKEITEISLGEEAWINSQTKINIKDTNDYFEITEKAKWKVSAHPEGTTISFSIPVPYNL